MNENNKNESTHKSEINATMAFTQSLCDSLKDDTLTIKIQKYEK